MFFYLFICATDNFIFHRQTEAPSPASDAEMALPVDQAAVDGEQVDEMKSALDFLVDQAEDKEEEYEEVKEEPPEIKPEVKNDEKEKMEPRNLKRKLPEPVVEKSKVAPWWRNSGQQNPGGPASGSGLKRPKPEVGVAGGESKKTDPQHRSGWQNKCAALAVAYQNSEWSECSRLIQQFQNGSKQFKDVMMMHEGKRKSNSGVDPKRRY